MSSKIHLLEGRYFRLNMELTPSFPRFVVEPHAESPRTADHSGILSLCCSLLVEWIRMNGTQSAAFSSLLDRCWSRRSLGGALISVCRVFGLKNFENLESTSYTAFCLARCSRTGVLLFHVTSSRPRSARAVSHSPVCPFIYLSLYSSFWIFL